MSAVLTPGMAATAVTVTPFDSLALLALKVAPKVFDLSSGQTHVSIRDQVVRGQLLVEDLCKVDPDFQRLLVVGAGVAGVAAALAAASRGKAVWVVDAKDRPFALQFGVTERFVGPFMYEWPSDSSSNQSYPPTGANWGPPPPFTPSWLSPVPLSADALATSLTAWLLAQQAALNSAQKSPWIKGFPAFWMKVDPAEVAACITAFADREAENLELREKGLPTLPRRKLELLNGFETWPGNFASKGYAQVAPDYVVLAAGVGTENTLLHPGAPISGPKFWANDHLRSGPAVGHTIGIFGGGDGGLQDVLRAVTLHPHPLDMLDFLMLDKTVNPILSAVMDELSAIEQVSRLTSTWVANGKAYKLLDDQCRAITDTLATNTDVRALVGSRLRKGTGTVHHFTKDAHFTKAYLLNRFLVHLIRACGILEGGRWSGRMGYIHVPERIAVSSTKNLPSAIQVAHPTTLQPGPAITFDQIAVRYGVEEGSVPGKQMINLNARDKGQRTSLAQVPMPFMMHS